jgi:ATP-dependent DNA helicase RecQ
MCTLWQRLGRAARAMDLFATGLFLVEPKRFDANVAKAEARAAKRAAASKKRKEATGTGEQSPAKRVAVTAPGAPNTPISVPLPAPFPSLAPNHHLSGAETDGPLVPEHDSIRTAPVPPALTPPTARHTAADDPDMPSNPSSSDTPSGSDSALVAADCAAYKLERRAIYDAVASPTPQWKKQTKKEGADRLEPALEDLINASTRQPSMPCIRFPVTIYFGNDTAGMFLSVLVTPFTHVNH